MSVKETYAIAGHETFAFRFAWLPKAVEAVLNSPDAFSDETQAMIHLGVGKNMVRSIRFWAIAAGVIEPSDKGGFRLSDIGEQIFHPENGLDPFMEDDQTLWLLHWQLAHAQNPLFAWDFLLNSWHEPELTPSSIMIAASRHLEKSGAQTSESSLHGHLAVFFHTYHPARTKKGHILEAGLDCPLVQLDFLEARGQRINAKGRSESVYAFRRGKKPEISDSLFCYALTDFWRKVAVSETAISFREVATRPYSPGQVFLLEDEEIRERLERLKISSNGILTYAESSLIQSIHRNSDLNDETLRIMRGRIYS
ncbi:MAG: DUF4007 family protein [Nitrospirales bacterium]